MSNGFGAELEKMMQQQHTLMKIDPAFGTGKPWPSNAQQWRDYHGKMAWLFNPWTEHRRHPADVGSDPFGFLILPPDEPLYAAPNAFVTGLAPRKE